MAGTQPDETPAGEMPDDSGASPDSPDLARPAGPPDLSGRHRATLAAICEHPTRAGIRWRDVEALLLALETRIDEGRGSRVRALLNGRVLNLHAPHPRPEMKRYAVEAVRDFLAGAGIPC